LALAGRAGLPLVLAVDFRFLKGMTGDGGYVGISPIRNSDDHAVACRLRLSLLSANRRIETLTRPRHQPVSVG
jgi:hypothetical protein